MVETQLCWRVPHNDADVDAARRYYRVADEIVEFPGYGPARQLSVVEANRVEVKAGLKGILAELLAGPHLQRRSLQMVLGLLAFNAYLRNPDEYRALNPLPAAPRWQHPLRRPHHHRHSLMTLTSRPSATSGGLGLRFGFPPR